MGAGIHRNVPAYHNVRSLTPRPLRPLAVHRLDSADARRWFECLFEPFSRKSLHTYLVKIYASTLLSTTITTLRA